MRLAAATVLALIVSSCSHSQKKENRIDLGPLLGTTVLYHSGRQATLEPSSNPSMPYGGIEREANYLDEIRKQGFTVIYLDGGDLFVPDSQGTDLAPYKKRAPLIVEMLNRMSLDVFSPGPNDWKLGREILESLSGEAAFPFVSSNVFDERNLRVFKRFHVLKRGGISYGVLGIAPEGQLAPGIRATSPEKFLDRWLYRYSVRCDVLIVLSQLRDIEKDKRLIERYPQISFIIGNDPRRTLNSPLWHRGKLLLDGYRHGYLLGKLTFQPRKPFRHFQSMGGREEARQKFASLQEELTRSESVETRKRLRREIASLQTSGLLEDGDKDIEYVHELVALDEERFGGRNEISGLVDEALGRPSPDNDPAKSASAK